MTEDIEHTKTHGEASAESGADLKSSSESDAEVFDMKWYVVQAYSGFETKVKQLLEDRMRINGISKLFGEIIVPQETISELVKGERKEVKKKFFPGYVLVQMHLNEHSWHLVKETPKVSGFLGDSLAPEPLSEAEVQRIIAQVAQGVAAVAGKGQFEPGDAVMVKDGPFAEFRGTVEEVRPEKGKIRVLISIFGRNTPVELEFVQVEKC
jgi:transcription termination/antitermination protein NusG